MTLATAAGVASATTIKRGIKTLLLGQAYRDALDELQQAFADGLDLPELTNVKRAELQTLDTLPVAEIVAIDSDPLSDSQPSLARAHRIAVRMYVGGDDEEHITDQVERYLLGVQLLFSSDAGNEMRLFPYLGGTVEPGHVDYDPMVRMKNAEATLVKAGTIELVVRTVN